MKTPCIRWLTFAVLLHAVGVPIFASAQSGGALAELTLPDAEKMLTANNRELALARRALDQASADVVIAGQKPNPQLSFVLQNINPSRGVGNGDPRAKTIDSIVRIDQLIERGGKAELRTETARRLQSAAAADIGDTARHQLLTLRATYFDLLAAQDKTVSTAESALLFERTVEAARLREKAGDLAAADVARIRVDALRARNDARAAEAELGRAQVALGYLIGAESGAKAIRAAAPWPALDGAPLPELTEEMVNNRADVRAARARIAAADKARELAQSLRKRDVSVGVQYEHWPNRADANNLGTGNSFGVAMAVPLFLRHSNEGEIARAQADWYAARDFLDKVRAQALAEAARARNDLDAARERLVRFEAELLPQAEKSAGSAEFAFRNGATGAMDLLDARRTLKAIQIDAVVARADHAKALAAFELNVGVSARR